MSNVLGIKFDENNVYHRFARTAVITVISLVLFILVWWAIAIIAPTPAIPTPLQTWNALVYVAVNGDSMTGMTLMGYVSSSLGTFVKGFIIAFIVAVPLGLLIGYSKILRAFASPIIETLRPIAPIAWAPIFMIALGYRTGPMLVVFIGIFFPLLTNVIFGVRKIDPSWIDASKTLGASQFKVFYKVMLPSSVPYIMNGIKVGLGIGWMCIVAAELYAPPIAGIGFFLSEQATIGYWPGAYAALVVIAILGILTTGVADYLHRLIPKRMGMDV